MQYKTGPAIKQMIESRGNSIKDVAHAIGKTYEHLRRFTNGDPAGLPSDEVFEALLKELMLDVTTQRQLKQFLADDRALRSQSRYRNQGDLTVPPEVNRFVTYLWHYWLYTAAAGRDSRLPQCSRRDRRTLE